MLWPIFPAAAGPALARQFPSTLQQPETSPAQAQPGQTAPQPAPESATGQAANLRPPLTLQAALDLAEKQNLELAAARLRRAVAQAGLRIAGQIPNPNIQFSASRDDPHESLMIVQTLELGTKRGRRIDVARQEQALTELETTSLARQVRRQVRETYYDVAEGHAETLRQRQLLELTERLMKIAQDRFDAGSVARLEVDQAELEVERARVDYRLTQEREKVSQSLLSALLNEPPATVWTLDGSLEDALPPVTLPDLIARAYQSNPELAHLAQELKVQQSQSALLRAERVPNLDLGFGGDFNSPAFNAGPRGQIGFNVPLFSRNQGELSQSSALQRFLEAVALATRRTVAGKVQAAFSEWSARQAQVELYRLKLRPAARRVESLAEESYQAGRANILAVLDAQRSVEQIERAYLDNLAALQAAFAALEETVGAGLN